MTGTHYTIVYPGDQTAYIEVRGDRIIVDESDAHLLTDFTWHARRTHKKSRTKYACANSKGRYPEKQIYLHRILMGNPKNKHVDHKNHNGLDCRRSNLRVATPHQNFHHNRQKKINSSNTYIGVSPIGVGLFQAIINQKRIGVYATEKDAALAYDRRCQEERGEFGELNFPDETTTPEQVDYEYQHPGKPKGAFRKDNPLRANPSLLEEIKTMISTMSVSSISIKTGVPTTTIDRLIADGTITNPRSPWRKRGFDFSVVRDMRKRGANFVEIEAATGVPRETIRDWFSRHPMPADGSK